MASELDKEMLELFAEEGEFDSIGQAKPWFNEMIAGKIDVEEFFTDNTDEHKELLAKFKAYLEARWICV